MNELWTLRHGQSKANVAGLIVSSLEEGVKEEYGLTETGKDQAKSAGHLLYKNLNCDASRLYVFASPFSRTRETAKLCLEACRCPLKRLQIAEELRERHFGCYDLTTHDNYSKVWDADLRSADFRPGAGGESVEDVAERLKNVLSIIEKDHSGDQVLIVAHGDTLSILWALVRGKALSQHRDINLQTGELRLLVPGSNQLL